MGKLLFRSGDERLAAAGLSAAAGRCGDDFSVIGAGVKDHLCLFQDEFLAASRTAAFRGRTGHDVGMIGTGVDRGLRPADDQLLAALAAARRNRRHDLGMLRTSVHDGGRLRPLAGLLRKSLELPRYAALLAHAALARRGLGDFSMLETRVEMALFFLVPVAPRRVGPVEILLIDPIQRLPDGLHDLRILVAERLDEEG